MPKLGFLFFHRMDKPSDGDPNRDFEIVRDLFERRPLTADDDPLLQL
ncbi:hypothetical protein [Bradyrhizobium sp. CCBAU 051011]|nr:hypothetical protein [Bradyrhizobium sp. CCBAU 051011]